METVKHFFKGCDGADSECELLIDSTTGLVIANELASNSGTSISSWAEHLASDISSRYNIAPSRLIWIEHYGQISYASQREYEIYGEGKDKFQLVSFEMKDGMFINPKRKKLSEAALLHYIYLLKKQYSKA